jgi:hypothetical protein
MRLDSSGNMGLGVTPKSTLTSTTKSLQLPFSLGLTSFTGSLDTYLHSNLYPSSFGSGWANHATGGGNLFRMNGGAFYFYQAASGTADANSSLTQAMTLDASGNLLIGTTSGSQAITMSRASGATDIRLINTGSASGDKYTTLFQGSSSTGLAAFNESGVLEATSTGGLYLGAYNGPIRFHTGASARTEYARITPTGDFCFGTTNTDPSGNSVTGFVWNSAGAVTANRVNNVAFFIGRSGGTGATVQFRYGGSDVGNIATNGSTTSYNASSDYRLKSNIATMTGALSKLAQLRPVTFKWIATGNDAEGFIAHELAEVCPEAVTGEKDAIDENGKPVYQGVDTSFLVATLTKAIQEQQAIIESQSAAIQSLTTRITALEAA